MGRMRKINEGHPHAALRTVKRILPTTTLTHPRVRYESERLADN